MTAQIINGRAVRDEILAGLQQDIETLKQQGVQPGLAVVLVGDDPASKQYVGMKAKKSKEIGMYSEVHALPSTTSQEELLTLIGQLNESDKIHGILVQLPLPPHIDEKAVIDAIRVEKDVDGFHPVSVGNMVIGDDCLLPCTPAGIIELIKRTGTAIAGKHAVVVGRSNIVGKPVALLLLRENATVSICHSKTADMKEMTRQADILVVAAGRPGLIPGDYIKPGAIVIDVGTPVGDVQFEDASQTASAITPVPGGVGPMTIAMLMSNTVKAAKQIAAQAQAK
ncbi:bifunctional 5,10-methylene-tetrahydrofolate dehydrogenase/5,10-methylene-tetrahydrofolate cyclohydrolase [Xylanibacillus composti]|uniref:Bifunctional protein FolD n=1 Tax=Xylanibacillus composti TaxID=1572762 RepID=A0A8J4H4G2_9BACL|nr:tetrahydrofolate dehydrogenase/cyclohydrolase catalytic domain-containing protein [Xylanibacillus composti]MDT9726292.1 bifunctional 5,10-methylene-tetrahydrofolate dehydrogenase/5,10-methylene-tetrahydrofolate cyclohydrolase [Xylanibacillus composti]GIQ70679.1 bifunctional protein FolD [Xylanibacillus composti]